MPKRRAASRWLSPSTWQAWRTRAYSSTAFILTLPAVRTGRKIRRRLFTPPPRPDTPAASVRDFLSAAYTRCATPASCSSSSSTTAPGRGASWPTTASPPPTLVADQRGQRPRLPHPVPDLPGGRRAARDPLLLVVPAQAGVQPG